MTLSETQASRHPDDAVRSCSAGSGLPPITRITFPACRAHYPGGSNRCLSVGLWCAPAPGSSRFALAFPAHTSGRHPRLYVSRLAQASLALRPTVLLTHLKWTLSRGSSPDGYPSKPLVSYPVIPISPGVELSSTGDPRHRGARVRHRSGGLRKIPANRENPSVGVLQAEPRPLGSVRIGATFRDLPDHLCLLRLPYARLRIRLRRWRAQCVWNPDLGGGFGAGRL